MRLLADECCDADMVDALRADGHDVCYVMETMPEASDSDVLRAAFDENRILLTEDKDFGELIYRLRRPVHGIVLLRFTMSERAQKVLRLRRLLLEEAHRLEGAFTVLGADKARIRPMNW